MTRREPRIVRMARRATQQPPDRLSDDMVAVAIGIAILMAIVIMSSLVPDWTHLR